MSKKLSKEEMQSITVGKRKPLNRTIYLAPYDPEWPDQFDQLAGRVRAALGEKALQLEHVGSTSIPGMPAKPIIDMILAVADPADEDSYVSPLDENGFELRIRQPDWHEHRMFKSWDIKGNLHVFALGCAESERGLAF